MRGQIKYRLLLSEGEKATLAEIAHRLPRKVLEEVGATAKPETILGRYRKLIANGAVRCRERLGGLLKYYDREAAQSRRDSGRWTHNQRICSHMLRIPGMAHRKKTSRPNLS